MKFNYTEKFLTQFLISLIFLLLSSAAYAQLNDSNKAPQAAGRISTYKTQKITYKVINTANNRYGYDIFLDSNLFIHQPSIPCIIGSKGFKSKADAKKLAIHVISKIRKGLMPPAVSISEMKDLGIELQ